MNERDKQLWMLVTGVMLLCLIALTFTSRKPWYLVTLNEKGEMNFQFPTEYDCQKAKAYVDSGSVYLLTKCVEGK